MQKILKPPLRYGIIALVSFFLGKMLWKYGAAVMAVPISGQGWTNLALAFGVTLLAHVWAGMVWAMILRGLGQSASAKWGAATYLRTNIAKYLPGNIWHFYGRIQAGRQRGMPGAVVLLSVLLEPLLMLAAAVAIAVLGLPAQAGVWIYGAQAGVLLLVLAGIHPRLLNLILAKVGRKKAQSLNERPIELKQYPWKPLLGEGLFLVLRSIGFLLCWGAICKVEQPLSLVSGFSMAWLAGLVVPGMPGGLGVFESVAIGLLAAQTSPERLLWILAAYRLVNTSAEGVGAAIAYASRR
jgi:glycosyltransferase 2 family protein